MGQSAGKPLLGFGRTGWVLLGILLALAAPVVCGVDLRYHVQRLIHERFGWDWTTWFTSTALWDHRLSLERPGFSTVSLLYVLPALQIFPGRVRWWWYVALVGIALAAPMLEVRRGLRFWPDPWSYVIWAVVSAGAAGICLAGATRSRGVLSGVALGVAAGALLKWTVETRRSLTTTEMMAGFYAWHIMWAVPLLGWAIAARVRAVPAYACRECGYDLRGTPAPRCPECGSTERVNG